ncbi:16S rRNA (cytidine(1402)-2'-O)-methyltransferase [Candidatus Pelagibacter sp. HIMB1483]|uniref:16S rRNA (cytidine(1402)-2'-O)-methyltransferase n=1 Tax=Candidatus Pelagibacter sp. HIMB1483 TaxID=3415414 RepID=UPI003F85A7E1
MIVKSKCLNTDKKKNLYIVSTPIGNLSDISFRAVETLRKSDYILCEDTRVSRNLLDKYQVQSNLISNHKFNEKKNLSKIIKLINEGYYVSLISDAGTPSVSDPGAILIRECIKNDIEIIPLPGPSAVTSAVAISGFSEKFFFYGFFPEKNKVLIDDLDALSKIDCSIVFFISPKKINKLILLIKKNFAGRKILICREMTKFFEEYLRSEVNKLELFKHNLKGELTIVISEKTDQRKNSNILSESDKRFVRKMINKISIKEISNFLNQKSKISKKIIYDYCLKIKNEK